LINSGGQQAIGYPLDAIAFPLDALRYALIFELVCLYRLGFYGNKKRQRGVMSELEKSNFKRGLFMESELVTKDNLSFAPEQDLEFVAGDGRTLILNR